MPDRSAEGLPALALEGVRLPNGGWHDGICRQGLGRSRGALKQRHEEKITKSYQEGNRRRDREGWEPRSWELGSRCVGRGGRALLRPLSQWATGHPRRPQLCPEHTAACRPLANTSPKQGQCQMLLILCKGQKKSAIRRVMVKIYLVLGI